MPALPDWFDVWVRRTRELPDADGQRQLELLLGAVFTMPVVYFWNIGSESEPAPAIGEDEDGRHLALLFTHAGKLQDLLDEREDGVVELDGAVPVISMAPAQIGGYVQDLNTDGADIGSLLVNAGEFAFQVDIRAWEAFALAWEERDPAERQAAQGFWIPKMSTEEEDFWEEHGL